MALAALARPVLLGAAAGSGVVMMMQRERGRVLAEQSRVAQKRSGFVEAVGATPLIYLSTVSRLTGCSIYGKAEHMNPGGSVKDRPAANMVEQAERNGMLVPPSEGGFLIEATGGNTGVGLAMVAASKGYPIVLTMPQHVAIEKVEVMRAAGAKVLLQPSVGFDNTKEHYYHVAARIAAESNGKGVWLNQFENTDNGDAHLMTTGPEIWRQTQGSIDAFVCASGTGGTISGVSRYLKSRNPEVKVWLIDPPGSSLASYVKIGKLSPNPGSTSVMEGIGNGRITGNFAKAIIDDALVGNEREAVEMAYWLARNEGVMVGPSAALNVTGAVKLARKLGRGKTIVTILCDGGERNRAKLWNREWLADRGLTPEHEDAQDLSFIQ